MDNSNKVINIILLTLSTFLIFTSQSCSPSFKMGHEIVSVPIIDTGDGSDSEVNPETPSDTQEEGVVIDDEENQYPGHPAVYSIKHYVSKLGDNSDGKTWKTAWNELNQIDWLAINPGDTILIDGGITRMIYTTKLIIARDGKPNKPITIKLSDELGRNGEAVLFGGRSTPLPYCDQTDYSPNYSHDLDIGITLANRSWIVIDGTKWSGLKIRGFNESGIHLDASSKDVIVRNVEISDNGSSREGSGHWIPDKPGVWLAGSNILFERVLVHDNGQDAFQSGDGVDNFTLRQSWLYNERQHPTVNESFNYCSHTDGLQIYGGGTQSGVIIEGSIIGPGFTNAIILGQTPTSNGDSATVNDVTLQNVLFTKAADNSILGYPGTKPNNWIIDQVTTHCPFTKGHCVYLEGTNHSITNSIVLGSRTSLPDGIDNTENNCQWDTIGSQIGSWSDPQFIEVNERDPFSLDNYALQADSGCAGTGSTLTSVYELLHQSDASE